MIKSLEIDFIYRQRSTNTFATIVDLIESQLSIVGSDVFSNATSKHECVVEDHTITVLFMFVLNKYYCGMIAKYPIDNISDRKILLLIFFSFTENCANSKSTNCVNGWVKLGSSHLSFS